MKPPKNTLYLSSLANIRKLKNADKLLITRKQVEISGVYWYPDLAPSKELFAKYITDWKGKDPSLWWDEYSKRFIEEMLDGKGTILPALRKVYKCLQKKNIAFICFCNSRYCHRYILGEFLQMYGVNVNTV